MGVEAFLFRRVRRTRPFFTFEPTDPTAAPGYSLEQSGSSWVLKLLTSGTLTFYSTKSVDLFAVGGGGGSGTGGGGGGYTTTVLAQTMTGGTDYAVTIGEGGAGNSNGTGSRGGTSSVAADGTTLVSAAGGYGVISGTRRRSGGNGGSGGGGGSYGNDGTSGHHPRGGLGGSDGANGKNATDSTQSSYNGYGGTGQGTTTRAFGESTGEIYAGGGNGGYNIGDKPAPEGGSAQGVAGAPNTGAGAGGGALTGGSGIVIIRNARG